MGTDDRSSVNRTNAYAPFWITKAALPHLKPGAAIINTSSVQAYDPSGDLIDAAQTKACLAVSTPGQPAELAPIYVLLASGEASCATGQVVGESCESGQP